MILVSNATRAVHVTQPGRAPVQIGPFPTQKIAEEWAAVLTAHAATADPDTKVDLSYHDPDQPHIDPARVPSTVGELIRVLPPNGEDEEFPGMYHLLACKVGADRATSWWALAARAARVQNAVRVYEDAADSESWESEHYAAGSLRESAEDLLDALRAHAL